MEPLIKEIIAMDLNAQNEVAKWREKRADIKKQAEAKQASMEIEAKQAAENRLNELSRRYEEEAAAAKEKTLSEYENALSKLHAQFRKQKETWLNELCERCIHG